jgi:hypothetical protein
VTFTAKMNRVPSGLLTLLSCAGASIGRRKLEEQLRLACAKWSVTKDVNGHHSLASMQRDVEELLAVSPPEDATN